MTEDDTDTFYMCDGVQPRACETLDRLEDLKRRNLREGSRSKDST